MCELSPYIAAFAIRMLAFAAGLALLPLRVVPISARVGLFFALLIFSYPILLLSAPWQGDYGSGCSGLYSAITGLFAKDALSWTLMAVEIAVGLSMAVAVSVVAYLAELLAHWAARLIHPQHAEWRQMVGLRSSSSYRILIAAVLLIFLYTIFHLPTGSSSDGFAGVFTFVATSLTEVPYLSHGNQTGVQLKLDLAPSQIVHSVVLLTAKTSLIAALFLIGPLLVVSLIVDAFYVVLNRYLSNLVTGSIVNASRMPVLLLFFSLCLYPFTDQLASLFDESLANARLSKVIRGIAE